MCYLGCRSEICKAVFSIATRLPGDNLEIMGRCHKLLHLHMKISKKCNLKLISLKKGLFFLKMRKLTSNIFMLNLPRLGPDFPVNNFGLLSREST